MTRLGLFTLLLGAGLAATIVSLPSAAPGGPPPQVPVAFFAFDVTALLAAVFAWRHTALDRRTRRAWGLMAIAFALLTTSGLLRSLYPSGAYAFPTPADLCRLAYPPVLLAGLLTLPLRVRGRHVRSKVWLDTAVVVIGSAMLLWYVQVGESVAAAGGRDGHALAAAIAYPALDLIMIFGATVVLLQGGAVSARRPALLLGAAMLVTVVGDVYLGYRQSHFGPGAPDVWQYACWLTAHFLVATAPLAQLREAGRHRLRVEEPTAKAAARLPYVAMALGYALLLFTVRDAPLHTLGLVVGAVAMSAVVITRQIVALRENHEMATTDTLTGLVNRRQLYAALRTGLARAARGHTTVAAVLIDMNGFKQVNDTMGHDAGDELLRAFGRILRANVFGTDVVARLGGDEFAIVLHNITAPAQAEAVVNRILDAMREPVAIGSVAVQPQASFGIALATPGETDADALLRRADLAMYRAKSDKSLRFAVHADSSATI